MNILDYAMKLEIEGEALYKGFARSSPNKGMTTIFSELAEQERKHYEIFNNMNNDQEIKVQDSPSLDNVKSVFADWKANKEKFNFDIKQADVYRKALDIEQKSIDLYIQSSNETDNTLHKDILLRIADEEKRHYKIIENIIEFITTPERWVEHAEFSKIGEEY